MNNLLSRRAFMERLGAGTVGGAALSRVMSPPANAQDRAPHYGPNPLAWSAPATLTNPNILLIMVDQLRWPAWLSASQLATLDKTYLPNIFGKIRDNSYIFGQYYVCATFCTPSRATLMTGLYAPQTGMYNSGDTSPALDPAFPTWGQAVAALNSAYGNNVWWFGKWHLSDPLPGSPLPPPSTSAQPLLAYGFNTGMYPGQGGPSPDGWPNEGVNGGVNILPGATSPEYGATYASDQMIANDFSSWLNGNPSGPWCATVSFVNPHDIGFAPGWFGSTALGSMPVYFATEFPNNMPPNPPPAGYTASPAALYTAPPKPWNWENQANPSAPNYVSNKPSYQLTFIEDYKTKAGPVTNWTMFLNQCYGLQNYVDQQVGAVLQALSKKGYANNTIVIFTSDHGEYAGSHGMHDKGGAAYDESMHVPLYIQFPGQTGCVAMNQMCSSVDLFGLMCDLAAGGGGAWQTKYPDLATRQSIWSFLYSNANETRVVQVGPGSPMPAIPYVLHTVDETTTIEYCSPPGPGVGYDNRHVVCLRTKSNSTASPGGKLVVYSHWAPNTTCWDTVTPQEFEFYDYNPATTNNRSELGNDYMALKSATAPTPPIGPPNAANPTTQSTILSYLAALGSWGPAPWGFNGSGLIASELDRPLAGTGNDGNPLSAAQAAAQQAFVQYSDPCNA